MSRVWVLKVLNVIMSSCYRHVWTALSLRKLASLGFQLMNSLTFSHFFVYRSLTVILKIERHFLIYSNLVVKSYIIEAFQIAFIQSFSVDSKVPFLHKRWNCRICPLKKLESVSQTYSTFNTQKHDTRYNTIIGNK